MIARRGELDPRLRAECIAMVNRLDIPVPFRLQTFCDRLAAQRGRPILLKPVAFPSGSPSGLCVSTRAADYIFFEAGTTALHQEHIVLHEIGHLLWNHQTALAASDETIRMLFPALDSQVVVRMLKRGECAGVTEQQAEMVATVIMQRVVRRLPGQVQPAPGQDAETIARLSHTLEDPEDLNE
jgi:hypothetical protein